MAIQVICPQCESIYNVPDGAAGRSGKCKKCGTVLTVPAAAAVDDFDALRTIARPQADGPAHAADDFDAARTIARQTAHRSPPADDFDAGRTVRPQAAASKPSSQPGDGFDGRTMVRPAPEHTSSSSPQPAAPVADLASGSLLDERYLIIRKIAQGGMGAVYQALDRQTELEVAIKVLLPELAGSPETLRDLRKEVATAQRLTHQNLLRVHDLKESEAGAYIVMEYIDGEDLEAYRLRRGGKLEEATFRQLVAQLLAGLDYLHEKGIVHKDIKPQNIMVAKTGELKLTDFGISTSIREQLAARGEGLEPAGTYAFMAPEQLRGEVCDRRTDIYALGIMFHLLLTGEYPFPAMDRKSIIAWHLGPEIECTRVGESWKRLLYGCLMHKATERFSTCGAVLAALNEPVASPQPRMAEAPVQITSARKNHSKPLRMLLQTDQYKDAGDLAAKVLAEDPENALAWLAKGAGALEGQNAASAAKCFEVALEYGRNDPVIAELSMKLSEVCFNVAQNFGNQVYSGNTSVYMIDGQISNVVAYLKAALVLSDHQGNAINKWLLSFNSFLQQQCGRQISNEILAELARLDKSRVTHKAPAPEDDYYMTPWDTDTAMPAMNSYAATPDEDPENQLTQGESTISGIGGIINVIGGIILLTVAGDKSGGTNEDAWVFLGCLLGGFFCMGFGIWLSICAVTGKNIGNVRYWLSLKR